MKETRAAIRLITGILLALVLLTGFVYVARVQANRVRWLNRAQNTRIQDARKTTLQGTIFDSAFTVLAELQEPSRATSAPAPHSRPSHSAMVGVPSIFSFMSWNSVPFNCSSAARK